jgi:hypothetical protein
MLLVLQFLNSTGNLPCALLFTNSRALLNKDLTNTVILGLSYARGNGLIKVTCWLCFLFLDTDTHCCAFCLYFLLGSNCHKFPSDRVSTSSTWTHYGSFTSFRMGDFIHSLVASSFCDCIFSARSQFSVMPVWSQLWVRLRC